jgi:hypothetical protein
LSPFPIVNFIFLCIQYTKVKIIIWQLLLNNHKVLSVNFFKGYFRSNYLLLSGAVLLELQPLTKRNSFKKLIFAPEILDKN